MTWPPFPVTMSPNNGGHSLQPLLTLDYVRHLVQNLRMDLGPTPIAVRIGKRQWAYILEQVRPDPAFAAKTLPRPSTARLLGLDLYLVDVDDYLEYVYADEKGLFA